MHRQNYNQEGIASTIIHSVTVQRDIYFSPKMAHTPRYIVNLSSIIVWAMFKVESEIRQPMYHSDRTVEGKIERLQESQDSPFGWNDSSQIVIVQQQCFQGPVRFFDVFEICIVKRGP